MSEICCSESDRRTMRQEPTVRSAADWLALAASPTFVIMALLTTTWGNGPVETMCAALNGSALGGMAVMYMLMAVFHASPWLRLIRHRLP